VGWLGKIALYCSKINSGHYYYYYYYYYTPPIGWKAMRGERGKGRTM